MPDIAKSWFTVSCKLQMGQVSCHRHAKKESFFFTRGKFGSPNQGNYIYHLLRISKNKEIHQGIDFPIYYHMETMHDFLKTKF